MPKEDEYAQFQGEQEPSNLLAEFNEDADIHPNDLSGDEQGERSIFATTLDDKKANFFLTVMTIVKTVIGSGILTLPFTMGKMGYVFGTMIFLLAGTVAQFGAVLLLKAKNLSHHSNLATIFYQIWKSKIAKALGSVVVFLNNIGICIAEMIIFKQSIRKIFVDIFGEGHESLDDFYTQGFFIVLVMAIIETPPTLVSKMEKLKFMALSGVVCITVFIIAFVIFFLVAVADQDPVNNPAGGMQMFPTDWLKAAAAVPNIMLALSYQMNLFPIFKGMKNVTDKKYTIASLSGIGFCIFSYILVALLGYDYAGPSIQANFLNSLPYNKIDKIFYFSINIFFLASIFFAFPILFFGCRNNFIALIKLVLIKDDQANPAQRGDQVEQISSYINPQVRVEDRRKRARIHFICYTLFIYAVIVMVALLVQNIESVFNIVGAICSTSISILFPCFFYVKLVDRRRQPRTLKYYIAIVLFCIMAPYALFSILALYINK